MLSTLKHTAKVYRTLGPKGFSQALAKKATYYSLRPLNDVILQTPLAPKILGKWLTPNRRNIFENFIFDSLLSRWFEKQYWSEPDPDIRVKKQSIVMGGVSGEAWADSYNSKKFDPAGELRVGHLSFIEASLAFAWLEELLSKLPTEAHVIQMGSSSGREVAYYASKFPNHKFYGTDLFQEVIDYSARHYQYENLRFDVCEAKNLDKFVLERTPKHSTVVIFSSGSFQYVQPEHFVTLMDQFKKIEKDGRKFHFFIHEPAKEYPVNPFELTRSTPRGNFSWNHNYKKLLEDAGFPIERAEIVRPYAPYKDFPDKTGVVHCEVAT